MPVEHADSFASFCRRNPAACPVVEILPSGVWTPSSRLVVDGDCDIRTDVPQYCVFRDGKHIDNVQDVKSIVPHDAVTFLIGCSFSFETLLHENGIPIRNIEENVNVSMFVSNIPTSGVDRFHGNMVVSMRPVSTDKVKRAYELTGKSMVSHGPPVHSGDPSAIGIRSLTDVDFGDAVSVYLNEIPVFWPCGVTASMIATRCTPGTVVTHKPGCMFVTDCDIRDVSRESFPGVRPS